MYSYPDKEIYSIYIFNSVYNQIWTCDRVRRNISSWRTLVLFSLPDIILFSIANMIMIPMKSREWQCRCIVHHHILMTPIPMTTSSRYYGLNTTAGTMVGGNGRAKLVPMLFDCHLCKPPWKGPSRNCAVVAARELFVFKCLDVPTREHMLLINNVHFDFPIKGSWMMHFYPTSIKFCNPRKFMYWIVYLFLRICVKYLSKRDMFT